MWQTAEVPKDDPLRQGDLLLYVPFPALGVPLQTTKGTAARPEDVQAIIRVRERTLLVVSHCCETSNQYLAVAPVVPKRPGGEREERALLAEEPPESANGGDGEYGYDLARFRLEPIDGVLPTLPAPSQQVAELTRIISFTGGCASLTNMRAARLSPEGRRILRIKLALFWGRPEKEDAAYLEANGIPLGQRPPSPSNEDQMNAEEPGKTGPDV